MKRIITTFLLLFFILNIFAQKQEKYIDSTTIFLDKSLAKTGVLVNYDVDSLKHDKNWKRKNILH